MRKKSVSSTLILLLSTVCFLMIAPSASAQNIQSATGLRFVCLDALWCKNGGACSDQSPHRAQLSSTTNKGVPNDPNSYVTECYTVDKDGNGTPEKVLCTTGSQELDQELFCGTDPNCTHTDLQQLQSDPDIRYTLITGVNHDAGNGIFFQNASGGFDRLAQAQKVATDANGNIIPAKIEWQSYTGLKGIYKGLHKFLLWNKVSGAATPTPAGNTSMVTLTPIPTGGIGGQQQGILSFPVTGSQGQSVSQSLDSVDCAGIAWDPYGRVFDTKTLEPIPDATVTLNELNPSTGTYDSVYAKLQNPNIQNPYMSADDGGFTFLVQDGTYSLTPTRTGYTHSTMTPAALLAAMPQIGKVYSDLYPQNTAPIVQAGGIQHRDIPMEPTNGVGYHYPLSISSEYQKIETKGINGTAATLLYGGFVTHPLAKLTTEICTMGADGEACRNPMVYTAANGGPDKNGKFEIRLDQTQLKPGEYFKKTFEVTDLTAQQLSRSSVLDTLKSAASKLFTVGVVEAQEARKTVTSTSDPIVTYLEGFAYDAQGQLLPNATVGIYVKYSPTAVYMTKANEKGYFKITSEYLPNADYTIRFSTDAKPDVQTELTTSQFLAENKEFTQSEKVNPFLIARKDADPRKTVTPVFQAPSQMPPVANIREISKNAPEAPNNEQNVMPAKNNSLFLIGVALLVVSVIGAVGAFLVLKKKQQE